MIENYTKGKVLIFIDAANLEKIVISTRYHIAKELIRSCNKYFDLKKLKDKIARRHKQKGPSFATGS